MATLAYLGMFYWVASALLLGASAALCPDSRNNWRTVRQRAPSRGWAIAAIALASVAVVVLAPFLLPYILYGVWREARRERRHLRTHHEYLFDRLHPVNLPRDVHRQFDDKAEELERLGFSAVGDFLMKSHPPNYFGRLYQSADGTAVCGVIQLFDELHFSFTTLFSDGMALETSSTACVQGQKWLMNDDRMRGVFADSRPVDATYELHRQAVAEASAETRREPLCFETDQVTDVLRYENRLFSQVMYERGAKDAAPPEPELPQGVATASC